VLVIVAQGCFVNGGYDLGAFGPTIILFANPRLAPRGWKMSSGKWLEPGDHGTSWTTSGSISPK
jgi:hypothetical protein